MTFTLHPNLKSKILIITLPLSLVFLEDNQHYPWLILVPQRANLSRLMDLDWDDQLQLLKEQNLAQKILWNQFTPTQINVAAIGNKTSQLHIHVIARYQTDPAWPDTVWDHPNRIPYSLEDKRELQLFLYDQFHSQLH